MVPRSVKAAALTSASILPKAASQAAITLRTSAIFRRSAATKTVLTFFASRSALTRAPFFSLRPQITIRVTPRSANMWAMASPSPWVEPVTTAVLPSIERCLRESMFT